jgi:hypothetical protein
LETADLTLDNKNHSCEGLEIGRTGLKPAPKEQPPETYKESEVRTGSGGSLKKVEDLHNTGKNS